MASSSNPIDRPSEADTVGIDPAALMRVKSLQVRAKMVVEGFMNGLHRSPLHGSSIEFSEYRPYSAGDDLRNLDWKLLARSDRYFVKKYEDETNRRCYLVVDRSKSMGFGSVGYSKFEYARTLAATLGYFLMLQRDSLGLLTFDDEIQDFLPARDRPGHFHQVLVQLSKPLSGKGTNIERPLQQIASIVKRRGLVILITDLFASVDSLQKNLSSLRARGHEVIILRTLDPSEIDLTHHVKNPTMVVDMETGQELYLDPEAAQENYQQQFNDHQSQVQSVCDRLGVNRFSMMTDQPLDLALLHIVDHQSRFGQGALRGGNR